MKTRLRHLIAISCVFASCVATAQELKTYSEDDVIVSYTLIQDRFSGNYISKYPNEQTKAKGKLRNGYKVGVWKFYDNEGELVLERNYNDGLTYETFFPESPKSTNKSSRNNQGFYSYQEFDQNDVAWQKRIWRSIEAENNPLLFEEDKLYRLLCSNVQDGLLSIYNPKNDEFSEEMNYSSERFENLKVVRYNIKEDWFFDRDRQVMESRIIGICPVAVINGEETDLFWVYLPSARDILAKEQVYSSNTDNIQNLDDVFYFRDFASTIYDQTRNSSKASVFANKTAEPQDLLAQKIEMQIIDAESNLLIKAYK